MRTVKSRRKRLQRGGEEKRMILTIQEFLDYIITIGTGNNYEYFGKYYNIVYKTLNMRYNDLDFTYLVQVHNMRTKKDIDLTSNDKFIDELKKSDPDDYINIVYDDIITNLNYEPLLKMYKINVFGPMMITKHVIRQFLLHNVKGSIVHVSSISAHTGYKGLAMYASSKGALEAFSKNSAREWGERGIRSNSLVAGFMETDMSSTLSVDQKNRIFKRTSMKVPTTKRSVSETIIFLLSESAESITGQNIHVDSGTI